MSRMNAVESVESRVRYEEAEMEIIQFSYVTDILTSSSPFDENQGEWDSQI